MFMSETRKIKQMAAVMISGWIGCAGLMAETDRVTLVDEGRPTAVIVLPESPQDNEQRAADELVEHIQLMSGAELAVVEEGDLPAGMLPLRIGAAADTALEDAVRAVGDNPSAFALRVTDEGIAIRGLRDDGTLFGAYELLEQLGVRWFIPGELGRVIPELATITVDHQDTISVPSMDYFTLQNIHDNTDWARRNRAPFGQARPTGRHGLPGNPPAGTGRQTCLTGGHEPGALDAVVGSIRGSHEPTDEPLYLAMGPHDGGGYCQCEDCRALDQGVMDPFYGAESMTDRYIWFFNQILDALEDDYPNLHIVWYVYSHYMMPPAIEMNPRIVGVLAPIAMDRIRGMDNPMSPDRHGLRWLIDEWQKRGYHEMYYRGYYNNLACVNFPLSQIDRLRNEVPALHERGVNVFRVEVIRQSWATSPLTLYLASKVMWDVDTDVDALLDDFYTKFYGPAEAPMRQYHEQLEAAFRDTPYFTGSSYVYFPIFKNHPRRDALRALLDEAADLAERDGRGGWRDRLRALIGRDPETDDDGQPNLYADRVNLIREGYRRMDLFLDMIKARNRHEFAAAHEQMQEFDEHSIMLSEILLEGEHLTGARANQHMHRALHWRHRPDVGGNYFSRFFRHTVAQGHERTVERGDLVAALPDEWDFLLDPADIGEIGGWQRPGELGGNWQPMKTSSRSWSDQGLHYYKAAGWYRTNVEVPAEFEGRPVYLWVGAVDTWAKVWVNGEYLGTSREPKHGLPGVPGTFLPFDMDPTDALNYGGENWVVVKVINDRLGELGTGGILAPAMLWSPHDPDWKPWE